MNKKQLSLLGLKWNPFAPDVPLEGLFPTPQIQNFLWRVESLARDEGGFALVTGEPGLGKSVALRFLIESLSKQRDVKVGILTRPQAGTLDFYRELGDLFALQLSPSNRWHGAKSLRERWQAHIEASLFRPILLIDEAQDMLPVVLNELRLLFSTQLDSYLLLTVVLGGDGRLTEKFRSDELLPLGSRIRVRLTLDPQSPEQLLEVLRHLLAKAGNPHLMSEKLMTTLCEHSAGNLRVLANTASELLAESVHRDVKELDEKLYLEVFNKSPTLERPKGRAAGGRR